MALQLRGGFEADTDRNADADRDALPHSDDVFDLCLPAANLPNISQPPNNAGAIQGQPLRTFPCELDSSARKYINAMYFHQGHNAIA